MKILTLAFLLILVGASSALGQSETCQYSYTQGGSLVSAFCSTVDGFDNIAHVKSFSFGSRNSLLIMESDATFSQRSDVVMRARKGGTVTAEILIDGSASTVRTDIEGFTVFSVGVGYQQTEGNGLFTGNVGVGTVTPSDKLVVNATGGESAATINADTNQQSVLYFAIGGIKTSAIYRPANSSDLRFNVVGGGDALTMSSTGNIGVGTSNPKAKLDVQQGDIYLSTQGRGVILKATDGPNCFRLTINNSGTIVSQLVSCP